MLTAISRRFGGNGFDQTVQPGLAGGMTAHAGHADRVAHERRRETERAAAAASRSEPVAYYSRTVSRLFNRLVDYLKASVYIQPDG